MFNTMGGRSLLVGRGYGTGAGLGQGTTPMPGGYYRPGSEYNWYSYAGNDSVNHGDVAGYQYGPTQRFVLGHLSFWAGFGLAGVGAYFLVVGVATLQVEIAVAGGTLILGGSYLMAAGSEMQGGDRNPMNPPAPPFGPFKIPRIR